MAGHADIGRTVVSEDDLRDRIAELGKEITSDYAGRPPLLVGVLKGAFVFMSDLSRAIDLPVEFDFMAVSSYGSATRSSGVVRIIKDLDLDLTGRHVLIVEDIVDSGLTLAYLRKNLAARGPAAGIALPSVRALARHFGVAPLTMHRALRRLQAAGHVHSLPRKGFYWGAGPAAVPGLPPRPDAYDAARNRLVTDLRCGAFHPHRDLPPRAALAPTTASKGLSSARARLPSASARPWPPSLFSLRAK